MVTVPVVAKVVRSLPWCECECSVAGANAVADLATVLNAINALHQPITYLSGNLKCGHDRKPWPCPTARLLHPDDQGDTDG